MSACNSFPASLETRLQRQDPTMKTPRAVLTALVTLLALYPASLSAQDRIPTPYFITYDHYLEEVDSLEASADLVVGRDSTIHTFLGNLNEFEYGVTRRWTTEFYLDFQHTRHEGGLYTGFRFEN